MMMYQLTMEFALEHIREKCERDCERKSNCSNLTPHSVVEGVPYTDIPWRAMAQQKLT